MISTKKIVYKICQNIASIKSDATTTNSAVTTLQTEMQTASPMLGEIRAYAGSISPSKWLICDGSAISRTDYADLFAVIGTTYGTGDGSTTFNLPDLKGRTPIGSSTTYALGSTGGEATHKLTVNEMPAHGHIYADRTFLYWASSSGSGGVTFNTNNGWKYNESFSNAFMNTGGSQAHNNMQPYTAINFIIYAGV